MERQRHLSSLLGLKNVDPDALPRNKPHSASPVIEKPTLAEDQDADATEVTCDESMTSLDAESWLFSSSKSIKASRNKVTPVTSSAPSIQPSTDVIYTPENRSSQETGSTSDVHDDDKHGPVEPTTSSMGKKDDNKEKEEETDLVVKETTDVAPKEEEKSASSTQDRIQAVRETLDFARECSAQVSQMQHQTSTVTNYSKGSLHHLSLEDRKLAREVRLQRALERVRREKEEAELQKAREEARRLKERKEKVYSLYMFYDMPSKKKMYKLATRHGLTKEDVNALPWMKGDKTIDQMAIADIKYAVGKKSSTHKSS